MKKVLSLLSIAAVLAACNNDVKDAKTGTGSSAVPSVSGQVSSFNPDTAGLAQFQQWKAQQNQQAEVKKYNRPVRYTTAVAPLKKSKKAYQETVPAPVHSTSESTPAYPTDTLASRSSSHRISTDSTTTEAMSTETSNAAKAPVKKGWSKAAKGTAIGAGSG